MHCNITSVFIWKKKFIHSLLSLLRIINSFVFYTLFFHWFHQQNHLIALVITVPFSYMHSFQFHFSSFLIVYHHDDEGRKINVSLLSINWILWLTHFYCRLRAILYKALDWFAFFPSRMMMKHRVTTTRIISIVPVSNRVGNFSIFLFKNKDQQFLQHNQQMHFSSPFEK